MCINIARSSGDFWHEGSNFYATDPAADTSAMEVRLGILVRGLFTKQDRQDERSSHCSKEKR